MRDLLTNADEGFNVLIAPIRLIGGSLRSPVGPSSVWKPAGENIRITIEPMDLSVRWVDMNFR